MDPNRKYYFAGAVVPAMYLFTNIQTIEIEKYGYYKKRKQPGVFPK